MSIDEPVADILTRLQGLSAEEILADAAARYPGRVALASSLGVEDQALTHMIADAGLAIPIFTLDTGRLYPETYELIDRTNKRYGFRMRVYCPDAAEVEKMVADSGIDLFRDSEFLRHQCCETRKVKPLRRAQVGLDAWVCGLRSGQGVTREKVEPAEWDGNAGLLKLNPLAEWDEARVWDYVRAHDVPYNPLHDRGFPSIGCAPCTRAVAEGEDWRAGRWWWESRRAPRVRPARRPRDRGRLEGDPVNQLDTLEAKSVHILREAYANFKSLCMLWSIGKDSTVLLWLARKAFFGHVPFPLVHIDTAYKIPEMIEYRDRLAREWQLNMVVGQNREALDEKATFPDGNCRPARRAAAASRPRR